MKKGPGRTFLPGLRLGHVVEEQEVEIRVGGQDSAYALLERIEEMNRSRFLPVIERVFDEFDRPGEIVRIDRLDLDLGSIRESELGRAEERLAAALREALRKAMPPAGERTAEASSPFMSPAAVRAVGGALIDAFLHFLRHGAWPYGSVLDVATAPAELLARLIATEPAALASMLRRHGRSETVLRRLVEQMPAELLERLLPVLEPADARWILVYMKETKASHEEEPLVDESPDIFERLLWTIVLRDALNRAGLRANRRAFLSNLIHGIAESGSASYGQLLAQLGRGIVAVPGAGRGADSLLSIIRELTAEERRAAPRQPLSFDELVDWLEGRSSPRSKTRGTAPLFPGTATRRPASGPAANADPGALRKALHSHHAETRWLLTRLLIEDGENVLNRLESLLGAGEVARLLWPAEQAGEIASRLQAVHGAAARARLLRAALLERGRTPGAKFTAERGASDAGRMARTDRAWAKGRAGARAGDRAEGKPGARQGAWAEGRARARSGDQPLSPFERIEQALSLGPDGDSVGWEAALSRAVGAAAAADPVGLRRLMRRFAVADPAAFLDRAGAAHEPETVLDLLLPASSGTMLASLVEIACLTPTGTERLVRLAATIPASSSPIAIVRRTLSLIATERRVEPETVRRTLLARARDSGGVSGRDLVRLLEQAAEPAIRPDDPEARRAATLDALRLMLIAPGTRPSGGAPGAAQLSSLSGIGANALRDRLGGPSLDRKAAAAALALLEESALTRLVLLLAPGSGGARADFRRRLRRSPRGAALAEIAAELLVAGTIGPEREIAAPPTRPVRPSGGAELRLVERALRKGGDALSAPDVRVALTRLLAERPLELVRWLASPGAAPGVAEAILRDSAAAGRRFGAVGALLGDPLALALAFGALPASECDLASALAVLIAGPSGRSEVPPEKAAYALARAAASMLGRPGGRGLAARWLDEILRSASLAERSALRRLIASRWPDQKRDSATLIALGLKPAAEDAGRPVPAPQPSRGAPPDAAAAAAAADGLGAPPTGKGLIAWLIQMLRDRPPGYARLLRRLMRGGKARDAACRALPETLLVRLLAAIAPDEARSLLSAAELIAKALEASGGRATRTAMWDALLAVAAQSGGVEALLRYMLVGGGGPGLRIPGGAESSAVWTRLTALAERRGHQPLRTALDELAHDRRKATARPPPGPAPDRRKPSDREPKIERKLWEGADEEAGLRIAIFNAGLVLTAPYLPAFFRRLDLLDPADPKGKAWRSQQARDRGIHLLQYLVEERCDRPEPILALNKLLCGQSLGFPVSASIEPTEDERATCRSLLAAMLANWPMLKDSSVEALQETFFQREGCIVRIEAGWRVDVDRKVLDVLVDSVPWGFSMILHPWMDEPVSVEW